MPRRRNEEFCGDDDVGGDGEGEEGDCVGIGFGAETGAGAGAENAGGEGKLIHRTLGVMPALTVVAAV